MRKILLCETRAVLEILISQNICISKEEIKNLITKDEWHDTHKNSMLFHFNNDYYALFDDSIDLNIKGNTIGGMRESLPFTVGATSIFVRICKETHKLCTIEQMFGCSMSINYYKDFITIFNEIIQTASQGIQIPLLPTKMPNNAGYLRFWVFDNYMATLYYPNSPYPVCDVEIEDFYRNRDCEINIHWKNGDIVAIDAWSEYSSTTINNSNSRLLVLKK